MQLQPTYKAVITKTAGHNKHIKNVQGGRIMTVNFKQTGSKPAGKSMLRLSDLRSK